MSTAEDFLLMVTDPVGGRAKLGSMDADAVLGGAILFDLVHAGRLTLDGDGRKGRVVVADQTPLADPVLEAAFGRVRSRGRQVPRTVVKRLGKNARRNLYAALATQGVVRPRGATFLGFPLATHDVVDVARRDDLLARVRGVLLLDQQADGRTGPLVGLLSAADLVKVVVEKPDRKRAKARAKVVSQGDWASDAVRQAIQAAQSAVSATVIATTVSS